MVYLDKFKHWLHHHKDEPKLVQECHLPQEECDKHYNYCFNHQKPASGKLLTQLLVKHEYHKIGRLLDFTSYFEIDEKFVLALILNQDAPIYQRLVAASLHQNEKEKPIERIEKFNGIIQGLEPRFHQQKQIKNGLMQLKAVVSLKEDTFLLKKHVLN